MSKDKDLSQEELFEEAAQKAIATTSKHSQIVSYEEAEEASLALGAAKKQITALENSKKEALAELKLAVKNLDTKLDAKIEPLRQEVARLNSIVLSYHAKVRADAEAKQREADAIAEKERLRLEKLAVKAEARGDTDKAEEFQERAAFTVPVTVVAEVPKVSGIKYVVRWTASCHNKLELVKAAANGNAQALGLLLVDQVAINRLATALHSVDLGVPGIHGISNTTTAAK